MNNSDISCNLLPIETIYMKWQILFYGKNIINLLSAELAQRVVKVEVRCIVVGTCFNHLG